MATATGSDDLAVAGWDHGAESKSDRYLAARLAAAAADFKGVAAATFALATAVATLLWLAVGVAAEHWLVPGGLPVWMRWAWFTAGVGALLAAVVRWVVPLIRYRVNLVYAARVIEQEHPELHNDLVNTVLVKAHPEGASPTVARSLERRAAKRLSTVPADGVADRGMPLKLACTLAVLVAALVTYELVAPKSLVVSAARLVAPWWSLAAPARVSIATPRLSWRMPPDGPAAGERPAQRLEPVAGTVSLVRGRQLVVETEVDGLRRDERAVLEVTPLRDDGTIDTTTEPWRLPFTAPATAGPLAVVVPDAARGLQQSVEFVVTAGDARSERVRVAVVDTPTLLVREVRYDYPPYIGRASETVAWQGDLRAPEFTKVTITAEGNRPLETAWIDPGCAGRESERKRMRIGQHDLARATGEFPLRLNADRTGPEFASYRLGFQLRASAGGREPPVVEKLEHRIEVLADMAPDVSIETPEDAIRVPPSAPVAIRVRAVDPDYGLARVGIETRLRGGTERPPAWLLERTHAGPFVVVTEVVPERLGAKAGDVLEYRAVAVDTRPEKPNVTHSPWRSLRIDAQAPPPPRERQPPPAGGNQGAGTTPPGGAGSGDSGGDARQGDPGAADPRESAQRGEERPERRDAGAARDGNESEEQEGQAGGREPNAGAAGGGGAQGQKQPEGSGAGTNAGTNGRPGAEGEGAAEPGRESGGGAGKPGDRDAAAGNAESGERGGANEGGAKEGGAKEGGANEGGANEGKPQAADEQAEAAGRAGDGASASETAGSESRPQPGQQRGEAGDDRGQRGQAPPPNAVAADGTNDGEAMERILDNKRREQSQGGGERSAPGAADEHRPEGDEASQQPACRGADGKPCGKPGCSSCGGGAKSGAASGGAGQGQPQQGQQGEGQQGEGQQGEGQQGEGRQGEGRQGEGQQGEGQQGEGQQGQGQQGQGQQGQGQQGQGQQGQGQQGQGQQGQIAASGAQGGQPAGRPEGERADGSEPGPGAEVGAGGRGGGDRAGQQEVPDGAAPQRRDAEWTDQDTAHARNAADLALEHLRDSVNAGRTDVLDELGWTPEQARAFIDRWEAMRRLQGSQNPRERGEFERAVRSLGLRPDGVRSSRDVPADAKGGQAEGRRSRPPAAYREQVEAYLRGTGGG